MREQVEMLEHHSRSALELHLSGSYGVEPVYAAQQSALAGAGRPDYGDYFSFAHGKVHMVHRSEIAEIFDDIRHLQNQLS